MLSSGHAEDATLTGHRKRGPMNALAEAARLLGDIALSPGQLAQLRALDRKYAQQRYERRRPEAELRAMLRLDILAVLTPEQERALEGPAPPSSRSE
jgi:hypothetical protein